MPNQFLKSVFPHITKSYQASLFGLADIQEYYNQDLLQMVNGTIQANNLFFVSKSKLNIEDLILISDAAKEHNYLDGHVKWLNAALIEAKTIKRNFKFIKSLQLVMSL